MKAWALMTPSGIDPWTVRPTKDTCWEESFNVVSEAIGQGWTGRFWKRWTPAIRSASKHGYRMVRVEIRPVKPKRKATHKRKAQP